MKKGDLVKIVAPPSICWELAGKIGVVIEYFELEDYAHAWFPNHPLVVVLVDSYITFFYEDEIQLILDKE